MVVVTSGRWCTVSAERPSLGSAHTARDPESQCHSRGVLLKYESFALVAIIGVQPWLDWKKVANG